MKSDLSVKITSPWTVWNNSFHFDSGNWWNWKGTDRPWTVWNNNFKFDSLLVILNQDMVCHYVSGWKGYQVCNAKLKWFISILLDTDGNGFKVWTVH